MKSLRSTSPPRDYFTASNVVITTYGVKWVRDLLRRSFCKAYKYLTAMLYT